MLLTLLFAVFVAGGAFGTPVANQYMDSVLNTVLPNQVRASGLDPAPLPNFNTEFYDKVVFIGKVKGNADYTQGNLTGLSQARRYSECQGPSYSFGERSINCTIAFDNLKIHYDGRVKYGKLPKVNIKAKGNVTTTLVFVQVISNQLQGAYATVKNFYMQQAGQLNAKFTGLGPLNRFMKVLEDGFKTHAQAQIYNSVSQQFQFALGRAISQVPMPN